MTLVRTGLRWRGPVWSNGTLVDLVDRSDSSDACSSEVLMGVAAFELNGWSVRIEMPMYPTIIRLGYLHQRYPSSETSADRSTMKHSGGWMNTTFTVVV